LYLSGGLSITFSPVLLLSVKSVLYEEEGEETLLFLNHKAQRRDSSSGIKIMAWQH
jgi:hypothetical protein